MARKKSGKKKRILRKILLLIVIILVLFLVLCFVTAGESDNGISAETGIENLELPAPVEGEQIIRHTGYTLSYNEDAEQPSYVAYELTRAEVLNTNTERDDDFRADPMVLTESAELDDYRRSGYDRGHMAPAADFRWSEEAMSDTFYMSNMTPQEPSFNRGIWADLEAVVRTFAYDNGIVYVVTGPVLTDGPYETIGSNEVSIPKNFYKTILDYSGSERKGIAFVLPNEGSDKSLQSYAMSIDDAERITGLDFYPSLPDEDEERIESQFSIADWSFNQFVPTGELPDEDALQYAANDSKANEIKNQLITLFVSLKTTVFEYLGVEDLARSLGLL